MNSICSSLGREAAEGDNLAEFCGIPYMNLYEKLAERWADQRIPTAKPVPLNTIVLFEQEHGVTLPADFREYLLKINGMEPRRYDEDLVAFLSLDAIDEPQNVKHISRDEVAITFAEYSLFCHWYFIRIVPGFSPSQVFVTNGETCRQFAPSFEEFVKQYLDDPTKVAKGFE